MWKLLGYWDNIYFSCLLACLKLLENAKMDFNVAPSFGQLADNASMQRGLGGYLIGATKIQFGKILESNIGIIYPKGWTSKKRSERCQSRKPCHPWQLASRSNSGPPRSGGKGAVFANFCRAAFVIRLNWASFADDFYDVLCNLGGDIKRRKSLRELCICEYEYWWLLLST